MNDFSEAPAPAEQSPVPEQQVQEPQQEAAEPQEATEKPRSRRESVEKALRDVGIGSDEESASEAATSDDADKAEPKKAEKAQAKAESATDAEKKVSKPKVADPARGPDGKFVAKDSEPAEGAEAKDGDEKQHAKTKLVDPPSRFSPDAKEAWKDAPEPVRAEVHRAVREMESGLQEKDRQLEPLKPYIDMARQQGVKIEDAMGNYVRMENMLRQNPVQGFQTLARNMGISPQQVGQMLLGQAPDGKQGQDPRDQEITRLHREMEQMKRQFGGLNQTVQTQQEAAVSQHVQDFAAKNEHFETLAEDIAAILQGGQVTDLQAAYDMALEKAQRIAGHFAPQPPELDPAPQAQTAQTRPARSVTGAPNAGSNPGSRQPSKNRSEALQRAFQRAGLA